MAFVGPVTALAYSPSYRVLCAGSGAELRAYDTKRCALITSCRGISGHRIQGTSFCLWGVHVRESIQPARSCAPICRSRLAYPGTGLSVRSYPLGASATRPSDEFLDCPLQVVAWGDRSVIVTSLLESAGSARWSRGPDLTCAELVTCIARAGSAAVGMRLHCVQVWSACSTRTDHTLLLVGMAHNRF